NRLPSALAARSLNIWSSGLLPRRLPLTNRLNRPFAVSHMLARPCHGLTTIHLPSWLHAPKPAGRSCLPILIERVHVFLPRPIKYLRSFLMEHAAMITPTGLAPTYIRFPSGLHRSDTIHPPGIFLE